MTGLYQFIPHHQIPAYQALGWTVTDDFRDCHHGAHSVLMKAPEQTPRDHNPDSFVSAGEAAQRVVEKIQKKRGK